MYNLSHKKTQILSVADQSARTCLFIWLRPLVVQSELPIILLSVLIKYEAPVQSYDVLGS